jgi:hypothetical protein
MQRRLSVTVQRSGARCGRSAPAANPLFHTANSVQHLTRAAHRRGPWRPVWLLLACALFGAAAMAQSVRQQEMAVCLPGEISTWGDGRDRPAAAAVLHLVYRHGGAPTGFDEVQVLGAVQRAAAAWSGCGVTAEVISEGAAALYPASLVVVQWSEPGSRGNFGLANLAQRTLSLGAAPFGLLAKRNPRHPAQQTLQMVISHEMGHFFGLMAHSRRCVDVMSYYDNGQGELCRTRDGGSHLASTEYRALLPTACDVARCRAVNGRP